MTFWKIMGEYFILNFKMVSVLRIFLNVSALREIVRIELFSFTSQTRLTEID
jgi:hypothetical protein